MRPCEPTDLSQWNVLDRGRVRGMPSQHLPRRFQRRLRLHTLQTGHLHAQTKQYPVYGMSRWLLRDQ